MTNEKQEVKDPRPLQIAKDHDMDLGKLRETVNVMRAAALAVADMLTGAPVAAIPMLRPLATRADSEVRVHEAALKLATTYKLAADIRALVASHGLTDTVTVKVGLAKGPGNHVSVADAVSGMLAEVAAEMASREAQAA